MIKPLLYIKFTLMSTKIFGVFNEGGNKTKTPCPDASTDSMPPKN
tara:strand:+ start:101 stop:235 length:135 start_codon:yes stop_codon:yes gene_type:complete